MTIIAAITDTHFGSTTAISPEKFTIHGDRKADEQQTVEANAAQRWLLKCWVDYWDYVRDLARGKRLVVFHMGDVVDGLHHNTGQVMNEVGDQIQAAQDMLKPIAEMCDGRMWITYGSPAHNGGQAEHETTIARNLGVHAGYDFSLNVDDVVFDLKHEGRVGRMDQSSAAASLGVQVAADYMACGKKPPDYVLRGHVHQIDDSGEKLPYTRAIMLPCWQLRTFYANKVTQRRRSDIGGFILDTDYKDMPIMRKMRYTATGGWIETVKV